MKLMKKIATLLLCVCMFASGLSLTAFAAVDGKISFNDPSVEVGQEVIVTVTTKVDAGVADLKFTVKYDPTKLEFVSGPNTTKVEDGKLQYEYAINQNSLLRGYDVGLTFRALSEGTTRLDIASYDIRSSFDIAWTLGYSQVTIGNGDAANTDEPVDEPTEEPSEEPTEEPSEEPTEEPSEEPTEEPSEEPADDSVDEPTEEPVDEPVDVTEAKIDISSTTTITLIADVTGIELPEQYIATTVTMGGVEYPAWQDSEEPDMYILYAQNGLGNKSLYRYDNFENTYQRFGTSQTEKVDNTVGVLRFLGDKAEYVVLGAAALLLVLIILVIVLGVKLYNRDAELDEVYDDLDEALAEKEAMKKVGYAKQEVQEILPEIKPVILEESVPETVTIDDVILETEEEDDSEVEVEFYVEEEDDSEVEVEFYVEEDVDSEEDDSEVEVEFYVEEPVLEVQEEKAIAEKEPEVKTVETPVKEEFFDDDDDDVYSGLPGGFFIDFIDLDD